MLSSLTGCHSAHSLTTKTGSPLVKTSSRHISFQIKTLKKEGKGQIKDIFFLGQEEQEPDFHI